MKIFIKTFLLIIINYSVFAQGIPDLVLTKEQNEKWFDELEKMDLGNQLTSIKERILQDTNVYIKRYYPHGITPVNESKPGNRITGCCKPLFIFGNKVDFFIKFGNKTLNRTASELATFITEDEVVKIQIIRNASAAALYGQRGSEGGVIIFTIENKESLDRIKEIIASSSQGD